MFNNEIPKLMIMGLLLLLSCKPESSPKATNVENKTVQKSDNETQEMVNELKAIATQNDDITVWHLNRPRALMFDEQLKSLKEPSQVITTLFKSGKEWLNAGEYALAIARFDKIFSYVQENNLSLSGGTLNTIQELLGMAYLRKGEVENCIEHHNAYSCILPIEKEGQHKNREGAEMALKIFDNLLTKTPDNVQTKWLYNITQMALGGYPNNITKERLISPAVFESETNFPRFTDKAMELGIAVNDISGSIVIDDFNNDHYLDLMVSSYGLDDQLRYFQNNKNGGFDEMTNAAGLKGLWSGLNMVQADYNNDGWMDVLILRGAWLGKNGNHPNSLLRNNGDGTFSDVTKPAGLYCHYPTQTASWADFNNDGWVDLFIANEHSNSMNAPCQLFQNNGDGTFKDVAKEKGLVVTDFIKGCVWGDYNNDGFSDLYLSSIRGANYLFSNGGSDSNFTFSNVTNQSKTAGPAFSFPCWFFDYNQDGWEDLFVSGFDFKQFETAAGEVAKDHMDLPVAAQLPQLYKNNQDGTFTEVSKSLGVDKVLYTMGCNFGDLNNDGYPDFYAGTGTPDFRALIPNKMFLNSGGQRFLDVTKSGGFGHLQKGHGVSFGDVDFDGDQDIYHVLGGSYDGDNFMNALFVNPGIQNNWIKLKLQGVRTNKAAIGTKIKITASNGKGKKQDFYNTVNSGGSFGANPLLIEQGLGEYNLIDKLEITWPGQNNTQIIKNIEPRAYYVITEGQDKPNRVDIKALTLKGNHGHHHHH